MFRDWFSSTLATIHIFLFPIPLLARGSDRQGKRISKGHRSETSSLQLSTSVGHAIPLVSLGVEIK